MALCISKNKGCNLAELAFYSDKEEKELTGTIIGTNASVRYDTMPMDKSKVFDKDILTYYEAPSTVDYPWVGLDFNKPVSINKIIIRQETMIITSTQVIYMSYSIGNITIGCH